MRGKVAQGGMVYHIQGCSFVSGRMGVDHVSNAVRPAERGQRVVSPSGRINDRSPRTSGGYSPTEASYGKFRWALSILGLAAATTILIVRHLIGG